MARAGAKRKGKWCAKQSVQGSRVKSPFFVHSPCVLSPPRSLPVRATIFHPLCPLLFPFPTRCLVFCLGFRIPCTVIVVGLEAHPFVVASTSSHPHQCPRLVFSPLHQRQLPVPFSRFVRSILYVPTGLPFRAKALSKPQFFPPKRKHLHLACLFSLLIWLHFLHLLGLLPLFRSFKVNSRHIRFRGYRLWKATTLRGTSQYAGCVGGGFLRSHSRLFLQRRRQHFC